LAGIQKKPSLQGLGKRLFAVDLLNAFFQKIIKKGLPDKNNPRK